MAWVLDCESAFGIENSWEQYFPKGQCFLRIEIIAKNGKRGVRLTDALEGHLFWELPCQYDRASVELVAGSIAICVEQNNLMGMYVACFVKKQMELDTLFPCCYEKLLLVEETGGVIIILATQKGKEGLYMWDVGKRTLSCELVCRYDALAYCQCMEHSLILLSKDCMKYYYSISARELIPCKGNKKYLDLV